MFIVVEFSSTKQVAVVPLTWVADGTTRSDIVNRKTKVKCYWPSLPDFKREKAVRKCAAPETSWDVYVARVLGTAG